MGNARSFLLAWLSIRARGGTIVLRMEDLDHPKVKPDTVQQTLDDLRWLGTDWDEGPDIGGPCSPYTQSQRIPCYQAALNRLKMQGLVYPCVCSRTDVEEAQSAPHNGTNAPVYPGTCRDRFTSYAEACATLPDGRLPAWRFRTTPGETTFQDGFHGHQTLCVHDAVGDFAIARHSEGAGYMLAVVVDDAAMGITEVLRGDDLLQTTHCQLLLYEALGISPPLFIHVPLVVGPDGKRLAKRHGDTRIASLREAGWTAEKVVGLLAYWCGWTPSADLVSATDLVNRFDLSAVPPEPVVWTG